MCIFIYLVNDEVNRGGGSQDNDLDKLYTMPNLSTVPSTEICGIYRFHGQRVRLPQHHLPPRCIFQLDQLKNRESVIPGVISPMRRTYKIDNRKRNRMRDLLFTILKPHLGGLGCISLTYFIQTQTHILGTALLLK